MSKDQDRYLSAGAIVDEWIADNLLTQHWYTIGLRRLLWGIRELRLDTFQDVKTDLIDVSALKTATLPIGFVDVVKIGLKYGQYCITLGVNDKLTVQNRSSADETVLGLLSDNLPNGVDFSPYGGFMFRNYNGGNIFGIGTGLPSKGFYKIHDNGSCKELLLDYDYPCSQVYVEYITTGFDPCKETILHPYTVDYGFKYMDAKYEEKNNPNRSEASIDRKWRDVADAERKVRARKNTLDPQTMLNISRAHYRLTPKA